MKSFPGLFSIACAALVCAFLGQAYAAGGSSVANGTPSQAPSDPKGTGTAPDPRVLIASKVPGAKPEDVRASPIPGIYEIMRGTDAAYVTADGKYAIAGDLYDLRSNVNLTDNERRATRLKLLDQIPESQMVIFGGKSE